MHVCILVGTRPEAIKLAPLILELKEQKGAHVDVVLSGQHPELAARALKSFGVQADQILNVLIPGQSLASLTAKCLTAIDALLVSTKPDALVVQGDTTTAMAGALAAFYVGVPCLHVEAGLRTGDIFNPFPEEANRQIIARLAAFHYAPTVRSKENLVREGVRPRDILVTGNTVVDAVRLQDSTWLDERDPAEALPAGDAHVLVTMHRRENHDALESLYDAIYSVARQRPDVIVTLVAHPNPRVRDALAGMRAQPLNVMVTEPMDYVPFLRKLQTSTLVITDSGGVQEEAASMGVPVFVLRSLTERTEGVDAGAAEVIGIDPRQIEDRILSVLGADRVRTMSSNPYGDGYAAQRISEHLMAMLGEGRCESEL